MQFAHKFTQLNYGKNAELSHECLRAPESEREREKERLKKACQILH